MLSACQFDGSNEYLTFFPEPGRLVLAAHQGRTSAFRERDSDSLVKAYTISIATST